MDIAIIGAGNMGSGLTRALTAAGHKVTITSTTPSKADQLAAEVGARFVGTNAEAAAEGSVVILAVYEPAVAGILDEVADVVDGKIVVDITNRSNENPGLAVDGTSNAERIQARVPKARVVKAFNTIFASRLNDPTIAGVTLDGFVAATDEEARQTILALVRSIGFHPVDAGPLESARILEAMEALNVALQMRDGGAWSNGWKLLEPTG